MASLRRIIQQTHQTLESSGIPDPRLEAEVMVMNLMKMARQDIYANQERKLVPSGSKSWPVRWNAG